SLTSFGSDYDRILAKYKPAGPPPGAGSPREYLGTGRGRGRQEVRRDACVSAIWALAVLVSGLGGCCTM
ncbi:hypothetical protein HaLaN_00421, partial [Haematococcus lacustris]